MTKVIAIYSSREEKCSHIFSTNIIEDISLIPPTIFRLCSSCNKAHSFYNQQRFFFATTLSQQRACRAMAKNIGCVEFDVDILS